MRPLFVSGIRIVGEAFMPPEMQRQENGQMKQEIPQFCTIGYRF